MHPDFLQPVAWSAYAEDFAQLKKLMVAHLRKTMTGVERWPLLAFTDDKRGANVLTSVILDQIVMQVRSSE